MKQEYVERDTTLETQMDRSCVNC